MRRPGITAFEAILSIAITSLVLTTIAIAFVSVTRSASRENARSDIILGTGRVLGPLDELLRQSNAVVAQYPASGTPTITTGASELVFTVPSIVSGSHTSAGNDYVTLTRDTTIPDNPRLLMTVYPNTSLPSERPAETLVIASYVGDLYIRYGTVSPTEAKSLTVLVTLTRSNSGQTIHQTLLLNGILRNSTL